MNYAQHTLQIAGLERRRKYRLAVDTFTRYVLAFVFGAAIVAVLFNLY